MRPRVGGSLRRTGLPPAADLARPVLAQTRVVEGFEEGALGPPFSGLLLLERNTAINTRIYYILNKTVRIIVAAFATGHRETTDRVCPSIGASGRRDIITYYAKTHPEIGSSNTRHHSTWIDSPQHVDRLRPSGSQEYWYWRASRVLRLPS